MHEELVDALRRIRVRVKNDQELARQVPPYLIGAAADAIEELQQLTNAQLDIIKQYQAYLDKTRWIKFVLRPLTEEEQREHPDWCYILDCHTPDDGQEILVSDGRYVWTDTFYQDGDQCYLDGGAELESCWWQPMPKPPKEE